MGARPRHCFTGPCCTAATGFLSLSRFPTSCPNFLGGALSSAPVTGNRTVTTRGVGRQDNRSPPLEKDETGNERTRPWTESLSPEARACFDQFIEFLGERTTPIGTPLDEGRPDDGGQRSGPSNDAGQSLVDVIGRIEAAGGRLLAVGRISTDQGGGGADVRGRVGVIAREDLSSIAAICSSPPIQEERGKSVGPRTAASLSSNGAPGPLNKPNPPTVGRRYPGPSKPKSRPGSLGAAMRPPRPLLIVG